LIYYSVWVHVNTCLWKPWFMKQSIHSSQCVSAVSLAWWILISMLLEWIVGFIIKPKEFFLIDAGMKYCNMDHIIFHIHCNHIFSILNSIHYCPSFTSIMWICFVCLNYTNYPWMKNIEPSLFSSLEQK
jgi:hypothetical protein